MLAARRNGRDRSSWEDLDEVPRAGLPEARRLARRAKITKWTLGLLLLMLPVSAVLAFSAANAARQVAAAPPPEAEVTSDGHAVAAAFMQRWLSSDPEPVPGGTLVGWEGAEPVEVPADEDDDHLAGVERELNSFLVSAADGRVFTAQVLVELYPADESAVVVSEPSLLPGVPAREGQGDGSELWAGHDTEQVPDPVGVVVDSWAAAWASGDPTVLQMAVGDGDPGRFYVPLSGVAGYAVSVASEGIAVDEADAEDDGESSLMAVRANVQLLWDDDADELVQLEPGDADGVPQMSLDVLVGRAWTASPVVVAWGPAGTGPELEPYENAVDGSRDLEPPSAPPEVEDTAEDADALATPSPAADVETDEPDNEDDDDDA